MMYKIGDRIPYIDGLGFTDTIIDQLPVLEAVKKYGEKVVYNYDRRPDNEPVVIYGNLDTGAIYGWDWVESLLPAEIYYSPLFSAMEEND